MEKNTASVNFTVTMLGCCGLIYDIQLKSLHIRFIHKLINLIEEKRDKDKQATSHTYILK